MAHAKPAATWWCLKLVAQLGAGHRLEAYTTLEHRRKPKEVFRLRKRKLQLLPLHFASSLRLTSKAGAFAYLAGELRCHSLHRSQISKDL